MSSAHAFRCREVSAAASQRCGQHGKSRPVAGCECPAVCHLVEGVIHDFNLFQRRLDGARPLSSSSPAASQRRCAQRLACRLIVSRDPRVLAAAGPTRCRCTRAPSALRPPLEVGCDLTTRAQSRRGNEIGCLRLSRRECVAVASVCCALRCRITFALSPCGRGHGWCERIRSGVRGLLRRKVVCGSADPSPIIASRSTESALSRKGPARGRAQAAPARPS